MTTTSGPRRLLIRAALLLGDQHRAVDNARAASTLLTRRRVEREEVELYLEALATRRRTAPSSTWPAAAARSARAGS